MKFSLLFPLLILSALAQADAQSLTPVRVIRKPMIQWRYEWQDGARAYTIGSAQYGDPLPKGASWLSSGYSPDQINQAYNVDLLPTNADGRGQTIAIIDAYGSANIQSDLDIFCVKFNLPRTTVQIYYPNGYPVSEDSGWASETTLDVEWAHALAPGARIVLVVDPDGSGTDQAVDYAATNTDIHANMISMSYGNSEDRSELSEDTYFQRPGVTYLAAAGDNRDVCYPACSPFVIAVGGTSLYLDQNTGLYSEKAWSDTGGGVSTYEALPFYQAGINVNSGRGTPDVSLDGDPNTGVSVYFTDPTLPGSLGSWIIVGGTSASTPAWAGIMARRASLGQSNDAFLPLIYSKETNSWPLNDITSGASRYRAVKGYDLATGLGTPLVDQIAVLTSTLSNPAQTITAFFPIQVAYFGISLPITPPSASSGLSVSVTVKSGPATITNDTVTFTGLGTVVLAANQGGNNYFHPAQQVTTSFKVLRGYQTLQTFGAVDSVTLGTAPFSIKVPNSTSGLPVKVTVKSGPATISGNIVTLKGRAGKVTLAANQKGNPNYHPAPEITTSFQVTPAN